MTINTTFSLIIELISVFFCCFFFSHDSRMVKVIP